MRRFVQLYKLSDQNENNVDKINNDINSNFEEGFDVERVDLINGQDLLLITYENDGFEIAE